MDHVEIGFSDDVPGMTAYLENLTTNKRIKLERGDDKDGRVVFSLPALELLALMPSMNDTRFEMCASDRDKNEYTLRLDLAYLKQYQDSLDKKRSEDVKPQSVKRKVDYRT